MNATLSLFKRTTMQFGRSDLHLTAQGFKSLVIPGLHLVLQVIAAYLINPPCSESPV